MAKARGAPLVQTRTAALARCNDAAWRDLFEVADTVSEGSVKDEPQGRVWYGSTSLILSIDATAARRALYAEVAARDVHVRLRAMRTACREATLRAPAALGASACDIRVGPDARGVRIDVDVQAPLVERTGERGASASAKARARHKT